jgi:hypothetical protein
LRLALSNGNSGVDAFPPFHLKMETDPCSSEYWLPDEVQKLSNSVCYTPSSESASTVFIYFISFYHQVWTALIPHLPLGVLLQNLRRLGRLWLLKGNRPIVAKVLDALNNQSAIAESNLHPALVFVTLRNYECLGKYVS